MDYLLIGTILAIAGLGITLYRMNKASIEKYLSFRLRLGQIEADFMKFKIQHDKEIVDMKKRQRDDKREIEMLIKESNVENQSTHSKLYEKLTQTLAGVARIEGILSVVKK